MSVIHEIAEKIAKKHKLPVVFIFELFDIEKERLIQVRRRNVTSDIRELLKRDYWEGSSPK